MKAKWTALLCALCLSVCTVQAGGAFAAAPAAADFIDAENWINLPGYRYVANNLPDPAGTLHRAQPTFPESPEGTGIRYRATGYYQSGDDNFAGIVYREKIDVSDFSITFTINKLGASSSAAQSEDGWIGIGLMQKPTLWHTLKTDNGGPVMLLRPGGREISSYLHEVGSVGANQSISNFSGSPTPPSANLDIKPSTEGATINFRLRKVMTGDRAIYKGTLSQIDFKTGEVLSSKDYSIPLNKPEYYFTDDMAYLAVSSSTDNANNTWDFSIKEINGVVLGKEADQKPLPAIERAKGIYELIQDLKIYENFDPKQGGGAQLAAGYDGFYRFDNGEADVERLSLELNTLLYGIDDEVLNALVNLDIAGSSLFGDNDSYREFLQGAIALVIDEYDLSYAEYQIANLDEALKKLPAPGSVTLETERESFLLLDAVKTLYNGLTRKAVELVTERGDYETIPAGKFDPLDEALTGVWARKYAGLAEEAGDPADIGMANVRDWVMSAGEAEGTYQNLQGFLDGLAERDPALHAQVLEAKAVFDGAGEAVEALKALSSENRIKIEDYENGASVANRIYYLPVIVEADSVDSVFRLVTDYRRLSEEIKGIISAADVKILSDTAAQALGLGISLLPDPDEITRENYLPLGYDLEVTRINNFLTQLSLLDPEAAAGVEGLPKLAACVRKISVVTSPISAKTAFRPAEAKAGEAYTVLLSDLFHNDNRLEVVYTASVGEIDTEEGTWTFTPGEAGEVQVTITISNEEFGQTAVSTFTVKVAEGEKKGCSSAGPGGVLLSGAGAAVLFCLFRRRRA